jgi:hypothetical protein
VIDRRKRAKGTDLGIVLPDWVLYAAAAVGLVVFVLVLKRFTRRQG